MSKIVAFDVDGTLVNEISSWVTVHKHFNTDNLAHKNLQLYEKGTIDYPSFMKRDIGLWPKSLHINNIEKILNSYTLANNANHVIQELKNKGYEIILISAGINLLVSKVANDLGVSIFQANGLETNGLGYLTGSGIFNVDLIRKDLALDTLLKSINCKPEFCAAIGDSKYDTNLLKYANCAIALGNGEHTKVADYKINDLSEILDHL
jgi:phosphoserine phosphatase